MGRTKHYLALPFFLFLLGCSDGQVGRGDIILITVDTLRRDHMSIYGYERSTTPNLDKFFAGQSIYTRAYSTETNTPASVASILSGLLPQQHGNRIFYQLLDESVSILPDYLRPTYQTAAFVSNMVLTNEAIGIAGRFDYFDDFVSDRESSRLVFERNAKQTTSAALKWLDDHRDPVRPLFLWVHYIDPHGPYNAPLHWQRSFSHDSPGPISAARIPGYLFIGDDGLAYIDAYDEEIAYMDSEVARLIEGYSASRPIDEAFVLFTADHGETMMEHERWFEHGYQVYEELTGVPLMLRGPGIAHGKFNKPVSTIDLAPTILAYAGLPIPRDFTGHSLLSQDPSADTRLIFAEALTADGQWRSAVKKQTKVAVFVRRNNEGLHLTRKRVYDLAKDPQETRPKPWHKELGPIVTELINLVETDPDPAGRWNSYADPS